MRGRWLRTKCNGGCARVLRQPDGLHLLAWIGGQIERNATPDIAPKPALAPQSLSDGGSREGVRLRPQQGEVGPIRGMGRRVKHQTKPGIDRRGAAIREQRPTRWRIRECMTGAMPLPRSVSDGYPAFSQSRCDLSVI